MSGPGARRLTRSLTSRYIKPNHKETDVTNATRTPATKRVPMDPMRKSSLVAGLLYLITFISIPTLALYGTVKTDPAWILGNSGVTGVLVGTVLELIVALAGIGTAVALYPVIKRQDGGMALGFVTSRTIEGAMIFLGVVSLLSLVTLQQDLGAAASTADAPSLLTTGASLSATYKWTFLVGQTLMPVVNALLLGTLLLRSGLVPRALPMLGLIGAPILLVARPVPDLQGLQGLRADHGRGCCRSGACGRLGDDDATTRRRDECGPGMTVAVVAG